MKENLFRNFLEREGKGDKAINSRISKLRKVENILHMDADFLVADEKTMLETMHRILPHDTRNQPLSNAVRKYYLFTHGREFPRMKDVERMK